MTTALHRNAPAAPSLVAWTTYDMLSRSPIIHPVYPVRLSFQASLLSAEHGKNGSEMEIITCPAQSCSFRRQSGQALNYGASDTEFAAGKLSS